MTRGVVERLQDILAACQRAKIAELWLDDAEASDEVHRAEVALDAISYNLIIIGEAVKALPDEVTSQMPEVPWSEIAGMRDVLAHHYYRVEAKVVRATLDAPLDELMNACRECLRGDSCD